MVSSSPAAVTQTTNPTRNGKRTAEEIIQMKIEDIIENKLVDFKKPEKKQKIVNGRVLPAAEKKKVYKQESISPEYAYEERKRLLNKTATVTENGAGAVSGSNVIDSSNTPNNGMVMWKWSSSKKVPQTPVTSPATGSKTLFMGNLSYSIQERDILNFFKDAGKVVEVRWALKDDRFAGYGHAEFATADAAQKALKLNGEFLLGRAVRLEIAIERGANTPNNGNGSSQKSGQSKGLTVYVKGFGTIGGGDDPFDSIRCSLEEHFGQCGEITRMCIPKDYESDCPKGVAFITFTESEAFNKALELGGSEVSGGPITVKEARQIGGDGGRSGRGKGGRSGGRGSFGGRDDGRCRGRGRGRGF